MEKSGSLPSPFPGTSSAFLACVSVGNAGALTFGCWHPSRWENNSAKLCALNTQPNDFLNPPSMESLQLLVIDAKHS